MVLVVTLLVLAVVTLVLVALFAGVSHQASHAESTAILARETMLADSAVALVIGQITAASTQPGQTWISQPGLLRTYGTNTVRAPVACYKLYSTPTLAGMTDTSGNLGFLAADVPANWSDSPGLYTDLNAPATTPGSSGHAVYPILDPAATNQVTGIQGVSSDNGAVAMPVAWLYELQDGTLGTTTNATAANPIVARVAFWTDDETCKVNINTAGADFPWNTPRGNTTNDVAWSTNQPAAGEYSAYPGHPATTALALALGTGTAMTPQQLLALTPRYGWGGSQFGTQGTTNGESVPARFDRLYASVDELSFSTNVDSTGQRQTNAITASQLETARFVLTAHSVAPETTLLGEPRIAIWPVADSTSAATPRMTAADRAITNAATIGDGTTNRRCYFFQRNDPLNAKDDFDPGDTGAASASNVQLFNELVARGNVPQPGGGTATLAAKYSGAQWTQIVLELTDYIHALNAVDADPAITPFASPPAYGYVTPLTTTYGTGTAAIGLRAFGRSPTLSSLTLVFYVSGFVLKDGSYIDFEETPDEDGSIWRNKFLPSSTNWTTMTGERIRAFAIPCTHQPACGYPEVSEAGDMLVTGLDGLNLGTTTTNDFGFLSTLTSTPLTNAAKVVPLERTWGGNEGPLAWRAASADAATNYPLVGTKPFTVAFPTKPTYNSTTGVLNWPTVRPSLAIQKALNVTVLMRGSDGRTLQTLSLPFTNLSGGLPAPLPIAEFLQDGSGHAVAPSYYMTLRHRVGLTGTNREFLIQPNDTSRSVEAATDLRIIAALTNIPATTNFFKLHPLYKINGVPHAHNLYFADGTAVYGVAGTNALLPSVTNSVTTGTVTWTNWCNGATSNYAWPLSPPCSCPNGPPLFAGIAAVGSASSASPPGDWDAGPGLSPDGAEINLPDAGTTNSPQAAYFSLTNGCPHAPTRRTPNALVPSPVIFGSLPAGINPSSPTLSTQWRTLLFCPYPASGASHPGFTSPPDHLILDNFWMPVVEPYPISTRLATTGKINLNDQIAPFTYLHRSTALRAVLDSLRIPAVPAGSATMKTYKTPGPPANANYWNPVDEDATIAQIESRFTGTDAYLSESEICTVPLVPSVNPSVVDAASVAQTQANLLTFWTGNAARGGLTGDNLRELPYAQLYGRLTTRSNSYTVHIRVQVLQKRRIDPDQNIWKEGADLILGDWRGSCEIERELSPTAAAPVAGSPLGPYTYRVMATQRFAP